MDIFILLCKYAMTSVILVSFFSDPESIEISFSIGFFADSFFDIGDSYYTDVIPVLGDKYPSFKDAVFDGYSFNSGSGFPIYKYTTVTNCSIFIEPDKNGWLDIKLMNSNGGIINDIMEKKDGKYEFLKL
jgi:hypothetical protein